MATWKVRVALAMIVAAMWCGVLPTAPASAARAAEACFAETGQCVEGRFLDYWQQHGGLAVNGFPLSGERRELLEDGNEYVVQYFERVRLEYHPENPPPYDVLLGQFGRRISKAEPPRPSRAAEGDFAYFPETGHNVGARFFAYWQQNGGLAQFGYPLTEEYDTPPGTTSARSVQYFERARFEYHPENAGTPYEVLLGQFGRTILAQNALLGGEIGALYLTTPAVREGLGLALDGAVEAPGAAQAFERGLMFYTSQLLAPAGARPIFVFQGDRQAGRLLADPPRPYFPDTWVEGQEPGGGPAPAAGLYLPRRGFGKVWREHPDVQRQLGYATTSTEEAAPVTLQAFERGVILAVSRPEGRCLYAVTYNATAKGVDGGAYRCYAPPAR